MDEKRDFNIAATLLDATKLFISKSKVSPAQANIDTNIEYLGRALQHLYIMKSRDPRMIFFSNR